ncbi:hypothetical protein [Jeotgalibacillus campisalis]|uniref:Uncharacterized protein n=1 Tax=Jeotgalibacillus campisalis TaxID=220754 RepID=A0A0C2VTZ6_9BACL|nr:hypothetical protein [Jeotgalibacillus campisalis]KIL47896.1 hypothetical protein KR50_20630 [Jeotgalibacillus campisalis]
MKIELNNQQYKKLIQALYLGDLVLHSMKESEEDQDEDFINTEQYLLSFAKEAGMAEYVDYDEELQLYFPSILMEQEFDLSMRIYEQEILPDQLAATLARNELEEKLEKNELDQNEAVHLLLELEEEYLDQITQKGLKNVYLK